ncbi:hypothetical protein F7725_019731 [Dissostichus mawsoni]|uniref:Uncharacterized protein n=1 Tax=Dissostichus mawsoni TaxID=36200 RepID=A0A7J5YKI9_DISMA|nr:hypothetical protein F7725_019731 [Dissostichus mawsoni]
MKVALTGRGILLLLPMRRTGREGLLRHSQTWILALRRAGLSAKRTAGCHRTETERGSGWGAGDRAAPALGWQHGSVGHAVEEREGKLTNSELNQHVEEGPQVVMSTHFLQITIRKCK